MKKFIIAASAMFALVSMGACSNKSASETTDAADEPVGGKTVVYEGVLPAADADGIRYALHLEYDSIAENTSGTYILDQTYLVPDSTNEVTKGAFVVELGAEANAGKSYIRLMPSDGADKGKSLYFLVSSDSTLTMTNSELEIPTGDLNYTLTLVK